MTDRFDAIVIGAGHNGMTLGLFLARSGLSTAVVEQADLPGGMARSDERLMADFHHHSHANYLTYHDLAARTAALDLEAAGLETMWPEAQHGLAFRDGRAPIVLYRVGMNAESQESIARHSRKDARTYARVKARADRLTPILAETFYAPPERIVFERQRAAIAATYRDLGLTRQLGDGTARQMIDGLFESPAMRTLMYLLASEFGGRLHERGSDVSFLGYVTWLLGRRRLPIGGMSAVPALLRAELERAGGTLLTGCDVTAVRIADRRARGIETRQGRFIAADRLVASSAGILPTYFDLVGRDRLDATITRRLEAFATAEASSLASIRYCLREAPDYRSAELDPAINRCLQTFIGLDEPDEVLRHLGQIDAGLLPEPAGAVRINSIWDPTQAPSPFHAAGADCVFPAIGHLDEPTLRGIGASYHHAFLEVWGEYAANMRPSNVLAGGCELSAKSERKMMFELGTAQYRSGIEGLYLCGAGVYPGGGVHGACAYNAYQAIAEDLARA